MSPQAATQLADEPSLAMVLKQLLDRDARHSETMQLVLQRQGDQNTAISGLQNEVGRLVALAERQMTYNERQVQLGEQMGSHAKTFERAFGEIAAESVARAGLAARVDTLRLEQASNRGATRMLTWLVGLGLPFVVTIGAFMYSTMADRVMDARADAATAIGEVKERHSLDQAANAAQREAIRADVRELQQARAIR